MSGTIRSTAGGFEYPDGSVQQSAVGGYERIMNNSCGGTTCTVSCTAGKKAVGGGCSSSSSIALISNYPISDTAWECKWSTTASVPIAYVICMKY